jgi:hypothetical protein
MMHTTSHRALVLAGLCAVVAGCSSTPSLPTHAVAVNGVTPGLNGTVVVHLAAVNRGSLRSATLDVASGTTTLTITTADLSGKLLTATTPPTSGQQPALVLSSDGVATLQLTATSTSTGSSGGPSLVDVVLDSTVAWTINLDGGATDEDIDMRGGHVSLVNLAAGVTRATVDLPARSGTQVVREVGGASELTVDAPAAVATRVEVSGGAGTVQVGAVTHTGVGGRQVFTDPGYAAALQRLNVELQGGVSSVQIGRT